MRVTSTLIICCDLLYVWMYIRLAWRCVEAEALISTHIRAGSVWIRTWSMSMTILQLLHTTSVCLSDTQELASMDLWMSQRWSHARKLPKRSSGGQFHSNISCRRPRTGCQPFTNVDHVAKADWSKIFAPNKLTELFVRKTGKYEYRRWDITWDSTNSTTDPALEM